ncbi:MAG: hypothetical protein QXZ08_02705 [Nitrososphaeria archaeon]
MSSSLNSMPCPSLSGVNEYPSFIFNEFLSSGVNHGMCSTVKPLENALDA